MVCSNECLSFASSVTAGDLRSSAKVVGAAAGCWDGALAGCCAKVPIAMPARPIKTNQPHQSSLKGRESIANLIRQKQVPQGSVVLRIARHYGGISTQIPGVCPDAANDLPSPAVDYDQDKARTEYIGCRFFSRHAA